MDKGQFRARAAKVSTLALLMLAPASGVAAPQKLDCSLTTIQTKIGDKSSFEPENRSISVVFDQVSNALIVYQDDKARSLSNVTITQTSMNGYLADISVGINSASRNIVLQTYGTGSTQAEFGTCRASTQAAPANPSP